MERKYPIKMFLFFVLTNFLFHFFYLSLPGFLLCIVGIWVKPCLWAGLAVLLLDLILSIIEQLQIRNAAITQSDNKEFNELMDAFYGPGGLDAFREVMDEKIGNAPSTEATEEEV